MCPPFFECHVTKPAPVSKHRGEGFRPFRKIGDELVLAMADDVEREPSSELVITRRFTPVPEYDHVTPLPHRSDPRRSKFRVASDTTV